MVPNKKYDVNVIADWFVINVNYSAGDTISHLKLQKLLYYTQAWHYTLFNIPLFDERIEAWAHGPVVVSQYRRFNKYVRDIPLPKLNIIPPVIDPKTETFLNDIVMVYGEHSASYLEQLTHNEPPWKMSRKNLPLYSRSNEEITLKSMKDYYSTLKKNGKK